MPAKRKIILRDSATILALVVATVALYAVTSFLFRSFETRRAELGRQYAQRGQTALREGHPEQAIVALRVAQSYSPDARSIRLLLAEALAQTTHTEEATNYLLSLRESEPADGLINLELARLARQKKEMQQAIDYYRASSLGNWQGDGIMLRREVQLELAEYLRQNGELAAARSEILVAAANAPETAALDTLFADKLSQANDPADALTYYQKAIRLNRNDFPALFSAGQIAYAMGDYATAQRMAELAFRHEPAQTASGDRAQADALLHHSQRILELNLSGNQPTTQRIQHIRAAASIANERLTSCATHLSSSAQSGAGTTSGPLDALKARWQSANLLLRHHVSLEDAANQDTVVQLIFDTETQTAQLCGPPSEDDALLLLLAKASH